MCSIVVLIPVYNAEITIRKTIESLKKSSFKDWKCVIVNDGSTDKSLEIINELIDNRFEIINYTENKGRGYARNTGLKKIQTLNCKYLCFLDADDMYAVDKLEWQFKFMENNKEIDLMSCSLGLLKENQLVSIMDIFKKNIFISVKDKYVSVPFASSIIRMSSQKNIFFDEKMRYSEDQDFMRRFLLNKNYCYLNRVGYYYNKDFSSSTIKHINSIKADIYSARKNSKLLMYWIFKFKSFIKIIYYKLELNKIYSRNYERVPSAEELQNYDMLK
ncbi:glycosyltransferase family A protein [Empedobacter sp.]|uniref:glycosyltransferase family 2 protein n=1 Tax=Empedobacter sp. TaxID=1927715 RepID=UPI00289B1FCA|nr:glycosyltransferase family A protein [Empedobacter sp.]